MSPILTPHGFSTEGSKKSVFHRQVSADVFHCVVPWLKGQGGTKFAIRVLVTSPLVDISFPTSFPDELGMPNDRETGLDPIKGVTFHSNHTFRGNKKEGFIRNFNNQAKPAIVKYAIPYLDKIDTLKKLRRRMRPSTVPLSGLSYALVHWHTGKRMKGEKLLIEHRNYLLNLINESRALEPVSKADLSLHEASIAHYIFAIEHIETLLRVKTT